MEVAARRDTIRKEGRRTVSLDMMPEPHDEQQEPAGTPCDYSAERAVLGSMMLSKDAISDVIEELHREDFYRFKHQAIYDAVLEMFGRGEPADAITVSSELDRRGQLARVDGAPYLHTLINGVPTATNAAYYAKIVADKATDRRLIETGTRIANTGRQGSCEDHSALEQARAIFDELDRDGTGSDGPAPAGDAVDEMFAELHTIEETADSGITGMPTGYTDFDELTSGLAPGQLIVVAGRPGMGKSTIGMDWVRHLSLRCGHATALFSLEMGRNELMMRLFSAECRVRLQDMRSGRMDSQAWDQLMRTRSTVVNSNIYIDDSPGQTMQTLRARLRTLKQRHSITFAVVDYMQLLTLGKKTESRQQEVSELSRQLKLLAKELDIAVVAVSQLNRGPEQRTDRIPSLADLRESGSIEQDADIVILAHRPDAYDRDSPRMGEVDLIVAKHRAGPQGTITLAHQLHYSRFVDMANDAPPPPEPVFEREHISPVPTTSVTGEQARHLAPVRECLQCGDPLAPGETQLHAGCDINNTN